MKWMKRAKRRRGEKGGTRRKKDVKEGGRVRRVVRNVRKLV